MKRFLIVLITYSHLYSMELERTPGGTAQPSFEERRAAMAITTLARLNDRDDLGIATLFDQAERNAARYTAFLTELESSQRALQNARTSLNSMKSTDINFTQALSDYHDLAPLTSLDDPDRTEELLATLQKPVPLLTASLIVAATPPVVKRAARGEKRSLALLSGLIDSKLFYGICAAALVGFYEARDGWKNLKFWWRGRKVDRLTAALGKIDSVETMAKEFNSALLARIAALEKAEIKRFTHVEGSAIELDKKVAELYQAQSTFKEYLDQLSLALQEAKQSGESTNISTQEALHAMHTEVSEEAQTLKTIQAREQQIQMILANSLTSFDEMRKAVERLGKKKK